MHLSLPFFFLSDDPFYRAAQLGLIILGAIDVFLIFFVTRDIILRTRSFWYQLLSIILVAAVPFLGFLMYVLIRPARTTKEREVEALLTEVLAAHKSGSKKHDSRLGLPQTAEVKTSDEPSSL